MKKVYFGSNLKMYKGVRETVEYLQRLESLTRDIDRSLMELFILPSYTALDRASGAVDHDRILLGAQNMCWEEQGQYTGEISPLMLKELNMDLVMIGHCERRQLFGESDAQENRKVRASLEHGFITLLCVGETAKEKDCKIAREVLRRQLILGLQGVCAARVRNIRIAYEPVWSIGACGSCAGAEYAQKRHEEIRSCLKELFGSAGTEIPVLYGGSVNLQNAEELITKRDIDGLFIGRAAWEAEGFSVLIRKAQAALERSGK